MCAHYIFRRFGETHATLRFTSHHHTQRFQRRLCCRKTRFAITRRPKTCHIAVLLQISLVTCGQRNKLEPSVLKQTGWCGLQTQTARPESLLTRLDPVVETPSGHSAHHAYKNISTCNNHTTQSRNYICPTLISFTNTVVGGSSCVFTENEEEKVWGESLWFGCEKASTVEH